MVVPGIVILDDVLDCGLDQLFVLTTPSGDGDTDLELRATARRGVAVVAYTSLNTLVPACGWGQPWAAMHPERLHRSADALGANLVALDVTIPEQHRYPEPDESERPELKQLEPAGADPALLYIPARPFRLGEPRAVLELQPDKRGRPMLLVYNSAELLALGCGPYQPWVAIPSIALAETAYECGAQGVLFNPVLAEKSRHGGQVLDWTEEGVAGGR